jgi:predicted Zn-dependent peptidase
MDYKLDKLNNGAKLLFVPDKNSDVCTLMIFFAVGSRYETEKNNGLSHFIEHLLFKGSAKWPHYLDLSKALDGLGAEYNAFTAKDVTAYYIKFAKEKCSDAINILSDMVRYPMFDKKEIEQERGVIIQEIKMYEDNPVWYIDEVLEKSVFAGHPLGRLIIGSRKNIKTISSATINAYYKQHYQPANMLVAVAGGYNNSQVKKLLNQVLGDKRWSARQLPRLPKFKVKQKIARELVLSRPTQQLQLAIGYPSVSMADKKIFTQAILATLLGGTVSSRLFVEIREKLGLAYSVSAKVEQYSDTGALVIKMGLDADKLVAATKVLKNELTKIKTELVGVEELRRAKDSLLGHYALRLETAAGRMQYLAKQIILGEKVITPEQFKKEIEMVTAVSVRRFAQKVFQTKKINVSIIGPVKNGRKVIEQLVN